MKRVFASLGLLLLTCGPVAATVASDSSADRGWGQAPLVQVRKDVVEGSIPPPPSGPATPIPYCSPSSPICP
jgi:hypothetical protein